MDSIVDQADRLMGADARRHHHPTARGSSVIVGGVPGGERRPPPAEGQGLAALVQVVLVAGVLTLALAVGAGQFGARYLDVEGSKRLASAEDLLEQTLRAVTAYSYQDVPLLDGSRYGEAGSPEHSDFEVQLAVTPAASGLLKVDAVLLDKRTRREIRRFVTYRGRG